MLEYVKETCSFVVTDIQKLKSGVDRSRLAEQDVIPRMRFRAVGPRFLL